jgi:poly(3-hydroxybutyrate) depolymerase
MAILLPTMLLSVASFWITIAGASPVSGRAISTFTAALAGCGGLLPGSQEIGSVANVSISSGGIDRYYLISIPPEYDSSIPSPVILSYHGGDRNAEDQLKLDELTNPQFNTQSFVVYPQGINVSLRSTLFLISIELNNTDGKRTLGKVSQV